MNTSDREKIESYLAFKYGVSLDQTIATDYIASDGVTNMWTAADHVGYTNDIFGIGRDDGGNIDQKAATSASDESGVSIALDNDFESANLDAARTTSHTNDLQFFTLSNDDGAITSEAATGALSAYSAKITRQWQVGKSANSTQNINL